MPITRLGTYAQIKGSSYKIPCKVATTANITLSGTQTIDSVAVVAGDRVLVKNQNTGADNGIYIVASGAWSRAIDLSLNDDAYEGLQVYVNQGTTNGNKVFYLDTVDPITVGSTSLSFVQSASGSGTSGTSGSSGTAGVSGSSGTSGSAGTSGQNGSSGTAGSSGSSGANGSSGTAGSSGTSGANGSSGTSGTRGTSGSSGSSATAGSSGTSATSGSSGSSSTAGSSGSSGVSGSSGTSGTRGTSGSSGTSGANGSSGTSGSSGSSGAGGSSGTSGGGPAGSTGQVQFNNAGAFGADSNFFWDNTNKRLGIGNASPTTALDVTGAATFSSSVTANDTISVVKSKTGTGIENQNLLTLRLAGTGAIGDSANINWRSSDGSYTIASINGISGADNIAYGTLAFSTRRVTTDTLVEAMRIDNRGNLGLGVTPSAWESPYKVLQFGSVSSIYDGGSANTGVGNNVFVNTSGSARYISTNFSSLYDQYLGQHRWFNAPSGTAGNAITFTQAMTLDASGRLGIGTANPEAKLHVQGTGDLFIIGETGASAKQSLFSQVSTGSGYLRIQSVHQNTAWTPISLNPSGSNVLIGTTTDYGEKLVVNGTSRLMDNVTTFGVNGIEIQWAGNTINDNRVGRIRSIATPSVFPYSGGLAFDYWTYNGTSYQYYEGIRLDGNGNVGIGIASPNSKIEIQGGSLATGGSGLMIAANLTTGRTGTYEAGTVDSIHTYLDSHTIEIAAGSSSPGWISAISVTGFNATIDPGIIKFFTRSSERARITAAGDVGIGTTSPAQILHTVGSGVAFQRSSADAFGVAMDIYKSRGTLASPTDVSNGDDILQIRSAIRSTNYKFLNAIVTSVDGTFTTNQNPPTRITFWTNEANGSSTERLRITADGKVGIGTSSPSVKLEVLGDIIANGGNLRSGVGVSTGDAYIDIGGNRSGSGFSYLDFVGDTTYSDYGFRIIRGNSGANTNSQLVHRGTGPLELVANEAGTIEFFTNGTGNKRMVISSAGEVWIGYTTDQGSYALQVNGSVYATSYFESSDIRNKNVIDINPQKSLDIDVIKFTRKGNDDIRYGYSAQQIMEVAPELVNTTGEGWGVKYIDVHTLKIAALEQEIKELKKRLN